MKSFLILASFIMGFGWAVSGCLSFSCTEVGCDTGVRITLKSVALKHADALPLDIKSCSDHSACLVVKVNEVNGAFVCDVGSTPTFANCVVTPDGDVSLNLAFNKNPESGVAAITVTVRDNASTTLFETTQSAGLADVELNGQGCGVTCQEGEVLFVPD